MSNSEMTEKQTSFSQAAVSFQSVNNISMICIFLRKDGEQRTEFMKLQQGGAMSLLAH